MTNLAHHLYVALVLPWTQDFRIDEAAYRKLIRYYLDGPFGQQAGLVVNPEAGEVFALSREEKRRAIEIAKEEAHGRVPIFAGIYGLRTDEVLDSARDAKALEVDGAFAIPPGGALDITTSWNPIKYPEVWLDQVKDVDRAVNLPIITHPVASPSPMYGVGLPAEPTRLMCEEVPNIIGWKMTYNYDGYRTIARTLRSLKRHVAVLGAPAVYFQENLASGQFDGTVSGSWNYAMEPMFDHVEAWRRGDVAEATRIWDRGLAELHEYVYSEYSRLHIRYKIACWLRGLIPSPLMRPPMPRPRREEIEALHRLLGAAGLEVMDLKDARLEAPAARASA